MFAFMGRTLISDIDRRKRMRITGSTEKTAKVRVYFNNHAGAKTGKNHSSLGICCWESLYPSIRISNYITSSSLRVLTE
jgi:hypothetical protein